jgi:predicted DsbA family dithiol-disulfide isomerase
VKVEICAEVTRPWCGLGSHRVDQAVARFEHSDEQVGHTDLAHEAVTASPARRTATRC